MNKLTDLQLVEVYQTPFDPAVEYTNPVYTDEYYLIVKSEAA